MRQKKNGLVLPDLVLLTSESPSWRCSFLIFLWVLVGVEGAGKMIVIMVLVKMVAWTGGEEKGGKQ